MNIVFDVETSRFPDGNPYRKSSMLVSHATYCVEEGTTNFSYYTDADFTTRLRNELGKASLVIGINLKFDIAWSSRYDVHLPDRCRVWDCQLAEFILSGQSNSFASMDDLCSLYGIVGKQGGLEEYWDKGVDTKDIPYDVVKDYNIADLSRTLAIYENQLKDPRMTPAIHKLILLSGADLLVLQEMEENGFKYNKDKSRDEGEKQKLRLKEIEGQLNELVQCDCFNWDSGYHLSAFLYGGEIHHDVYESVSKVYKSGPRIGQEYYQNKFVETKVYKYPGLFKPIPKTEVKASTPENPIYETNQPVLLQLVKRTKQQKEVIALLLERAEIAKLVDTYFFKLPERMDAMEWGDTIHCTFNQVVARTGRLSSSNPNLQNVPKSVSAMFESQYAC